MDEKVVVKQGEPEKELSEVDAVVEIDAAIQRVKEPGGRIRVVHAIASLYGVALRD